MKRDFLSTLNCKALIPALAFSVFAVGISVAEGDPTVDFGGQIRLRYENWSDAGTVNDNDESLLLTRILIHSDIQVSDALRIFVEGKAALATDQDFRGLDTDELALQQAFADLTVSEDLTVRAGRQELLFGKQRLVSPLDWSNIRRTWDGVRVDTALGDWNVAAFWSQFVAVDKYDFNEANAQEQF
ncbi:MAG: alginate export family protein, partial [Planctomycetota bacterium]